MGAAVQFVGSKPVIRAFEKMDCPRWSIWTTSKDMLISCNMDDMADSTRELEEWLGMIRGNTTGIFTLKLYSKGVKEIKPSTPHDYAFNFRMSQEETERTMSGVPYGMEKVIETMTARFEKLDERFKKLEENQEEPLAPWERALEHPVVMAGISKFLNIDASKFQVAESVSGVPGQSDDGDTLEELRKLDPDIDKRLEKLLRIARKDLKKYKFFGTLLDSQPG